MKVNQYKNYTILNCEVTHWLMLSIKGADHLSDRLLRDCLTRMGTVCNILMAARVQPCQ